MKLQSHALGAITLSRFERKKKSYETRRCKKNEFYISSSE